MSNGDRMTGGHRGARPADRSTSRPGSCPNTGEEPTAEVQWERDHPEGRVDWRTSRNIVLWNFRVGDVRLKREHKDALDQLAATLVTREALLRGVRIRLVGRASDTGSEDLNDELSHGRVDAAREWLKGQIIENMPTRYATGRLADIPNRERLDRQLIAVHYGENRPLIPRITAELRAYNRSVEITIEPPIRRDCNLEEALRGSRQRQEVIDLLLPHVRRNSERVKGGEPVVLVVPNRLPGRLGEGDIVLKMCCSSRRPVGIAWLFPEDVDFYRRLEQMGFDLPLSAQALVEAFRGSNREFVRITQENPCARASEIRQLYRSSIDESLKRLLRAIALDILGPQGRGGAVGGIIQLYSEGLTKLYELIQQTLGDE